MIQEKEDTAANTSNTKSDLNSTIENIIEMGTPLLMNVVKSLVQPESSQPQNMQNPHEILQQVLSEMTGKAMPKTEKEDDEKKEETKTEEKVDATATA